MARKKVKNDKFHEIRLLSASYQEPLNFSIICKFIRQTFQVSQADMAQKLNVQLRTYKHWEYGEREPSSTLAVNLYIMFLEAKEESARQQIFKETATNNQYPSNNQAA